MRSRSERGRVRGATCLLAVGALLGCGGPPELDPSGDPRAFWAWCTDAGRGRAAGSAPVEDAADLEALEGVSLVEGDLTITSATLTSLASLADLRCVRGDLIIEGNEQLTSLAGLESLVAVEGEVVIRGNARLTDLAGLSGLEHVAPFGGRADVTISSNPALVSIVGLTALETIHGDLDVQANLALVDLAGLDALFTIERDLHVRNNESLVGVGALANIGSVGHAIRIEHNPSLDDVALPSVRRVGDEDADLTLSFNGVRIRDNDALRTIRLGRLEAARTIVVDGNELLEGVDLAGLIQVASESPVSGELLVVSGALTTIELSSLETVRGDLRVDGPVLDSLSAPRLTDVEGDLSVGDDAVFPRRAPALTTLDLASLRAVEDSLHIRNTALLDLSGVPALVSVGRELDIEHNQFLTSLGGLTELSTLGSLTIASNRSLPMCEAEAFEARLLALGFSGSVRIAANDDMGVCP